VGVGGAWCLGSLDRIATRKSCEQGRRSGAARDENGRKTQPFSTFTFKYKNKSENGKAEHENEREFTEYREFRKRTNSSEIMSNTVGIQKFNTEYRPTMHNN
jgi:hypothetical protein